MLPPGTVPGTLAGSATVLLWPHPLTTGASASHALTALHQALTSLHAVSASLRIQSLKVWGPHVTHWQ
jgi:hypothetical protein